MLGYACAKRRQRGEFLSLLIDYREVLRELQYLRAQTRELRLELDRTRRIDAGVAVIERDGAVLH
jgi:hypothetical protein